MKTIALTLFAAALGFAQSHIDHAFHGTPGSQKHSRNSGHKTRTEETGAKQTARAQQAKAQRSANAIHPGRGEAG